MERNGIFQIGVNYWASNAGADMWRAWDAQTVEKDLALLAANGVTVLRVFPNWRDFQPVEPMVGGGNRVREYRMTGDTLPENPWYLKEEMLERFSQLCRIAQGHGIRLIVGLITGWMSGRLYIPAALYGRNIFTDPVSLYFQQLFLRGFVERMKGEPAIAAWDLGNECNCMDAPGSREAAYSWTAMVVNAIRAVDADRPVVSGMHSLELGGVWNITDQGALTDVLTTHPYPFWVEHCQLTPLNSFRTLLHATAQTCYYSSVGKKPCLVEELGSMGPMNCSEELAAQFLKANLWSNWAHGAPGLLWWCGFDQSHLEAPPYDWNMCERELGMVDGNGQPKPSLLEMKTFAQEQKMLGMQLAAPKKDGVCILGWGQDHWGVAYMSFLLGKQAGLTLDFAYCDQELPESDLYFLPSVHMDNMSRRSYMALKARVAAGATLMITNRDGIFTEFAEFTGLQVITAAKAASHCRTNWRGENLALSSPHTYRLRAVRAEVLARDEAGNPVFTRASYGKGTVFYLNYPLEEMLMTNAEDGKYYRFYETAAAAVLEKRCYGKSNPDVGMTEHPGVGETTLVLVNYSEESQDAGLIFRDGVQAELLYGDPARLEPCGAAVLRWKNQ